MEIRSFLAFEVPRGIKDVIEEIYLAGKDLPLGVRWIALHNIHLTVVFLGDVPGEQISPLGKTAGKVCAKHQKFSIRCGELGYFGHRRHPRVLWLGLCGDTHRMGRFRDDLQNSLKSFGIITEKRPYKPHLTLGRFKKEARPWPPLDTMISDYANLNDSAHHLVELVLFKSVLTPQGAVYTKLDAWPLGGTGKFLDNERDTNR